MQRIFFLQIYRKVLNPNVINKKSSVKVLFTQPFHTSRFHLVDEKSQLKSDEQTDSTKQMNQSNQNQNPSTNPELKSDVNGAYNLADTAVKRIGSTFHYAEQQMTDIETRIMERFHESNRERFRLYFFGSFVLLLTIYGVYGESIRKRITQGTADLAKETLENENLKIQTQELAMAVVQTVLNDKEITALAATFLKEASTANETQQALLELTLHILQHPDSLKELTVLAKELINNLSQDPDVIKTLNQIFIKILESPDFKNAAVVLISELCKDPEVLKVAVELTMNVLSKPEVFNSTTVLLQTSSSKVLDDKQILSQSRQFITDVMGDDLLQKEGGNALINTMYHALKPGVIRMTGVGLVALSIGLFKLCISPY